MSINPTKPLHLTTRDPVCGMTVDPGTAKFTYSHRGRNYYFCCAHCLEKFKTDPEKYLEKPASAVSSTLVTLGGPASAKRSIGEARSPCSSGCWRRSASRSTSRTSPTTTRRTAV